MPMKVDELDHGAHVKVLVTGGSGFIGSYFYERLVADGHDVVFIDLVERRRTTRRAPSITRATSATSTR